MHRAWFLIGLVLAGSAGAAEVIDGIAATVDDRVVTISDLDRMEAVFLLPKLEGEAQDAYRKRMLQHLIDRILQRRDIRRFSTIEVDPKAVDRQLEDYVSRHGSREAFESTIRSVGMTMDDVRGILAAEIEVSTYVDERFAPLVFIPLEDVEQFYRGEWTETRRKEGLEVRPFAEVREMLRDLLRSEQLADEVDKWTTELRSRANVDVFVYR